jgi:hypothetical protein
MFTLTTLDSHFLDSNYSFTSVTRKPRDYGLIIDKGKPVRGEGPVYVSLSQPVSQPVFN